MKITELIHELYNVLELQGNLDVVIEKNEWYYPVDGLEEEMKEYLWVIDSKEDFLTEKLLVLTI